MEVDAAKAGKNCGEGVGPHVAKHFSHHDFLSANQILGLYGPTACTYAVAPKVRAWLSKLTKFWSPL